MKSFLVIGMGEFGLLLAQKLTALNQDVMIIDENAERIETLSSHFTDAQIGDCTNMEVLKSLGVGNFDICFVAIGENFQASLEITSLLKDLGAKRVVSKAKSGIQEKFLLRNGADEVIYPERICAEKLAIRHSANNVFDYIELTPEYSIFEIPVLPAWMGSSIMSLNVRRKHGVNILAIKNDCKLTPAPGADYVFQPLDHLVVIGKPSDVYKLTNKI